jgi:crotonobetainyl-CoA:carnitine CoA-transferase CaiB-like acyl-CoA transferase
VAEIRDVATAFRIPNAPVANGANIADLDHFQERRSFVANPRDGFQQPGHPYRMQPRLLRPPQAAPWLGEHTAHYRQARRPAQQPTKPDSVADGLPFKGLRVLDMTTFWAGPSCTHFLGMLGAAVIHVESTRKPDGTRLIAGVPVTEHSWWEKSPIYSALNTNKKGLTLDLQTAAGRGRSRIVRPTSRNCSSATSSRTSVTRSTIEWHTAPYRCGFPPDPIASICGPHLSSASTTTSCSLKSG